MIQTDFFFFRSISITDMWPWLPQASRNCGRGRSGGARRMCVSGWCACGLSFVHVPFVARPFRDARTSFLSWHTHASAQNCVRQSSSVQSMRLMFFFFFQILLDSARMPVRCDGAPCPAACARDAHTGVRGESLGREGLWPWKQEQAITCFLP